MRQAHLAHLAQVAKIAGREVPELAQKFVFKPAVLGRAEGKTAKSKTSKSSGQSTSRGGSSQRRRTREGSTRSMTRAVKAGPGSHSGNRSSEW